MTSYRDALVLLNDLEEFAETHEFPEAEDLIEKARVALEQDLGTDLHSVRKSPREPQVYLIQ